MEKKDYVIAEGHITIKKDSRLRITLVALQATTIFLVMGGVFLWMMLDSAHFTERTRSLALWFFPLTMAFLLLGDLGLFIYLKKSAKEILIFTKEGLRIEGRKEPIIISKEDISRITFSTTCFNAALKTLEIATRKPGVISFCDAAIPTAEIPAVKKAIEALLELKK